MEPTSLLLARNVYSARYVCRFGCVRHMWPAYWCPWVSVELMPLLFFTSLLTLLLLPLSLSCNSKRPHQDIRDDYEIVRTHLNNIEENITNALQNSTYPEVRHKSRNCTSRNTDIVDTLHRLACKMKNLGLSETKELTRSVLNSIRCSCAEKPTKESTSESKKKPTASRRRRNEQRKNQREVKKLFKIKALLAAMAECYHMLNSQDSTGT